MRLINLNCTIICIMSTNRFSLFHANFEHGYSTFLDPLNSTFPLILYLIECVRVHSCNVAYI